jgi:hypothetical protein
MTSYTVGFFDEKKGVRSYTRLTSFVAFFVACVITFYSIYTSQNNFELIVTFLAYSGGQKIAQKFTETTKEAEIGKG